MSDHEWRRSAEGSHSKPAAEHDRPGNETAAANFSEALGDPQPETPECAGARARKPCSAHARGAGMERASSNSAATSLSDTTTTSGRRTSK